MTCPKSACPPRVLHGWVVPRGAHWNDVGGGWCRYATGPAVLPKFGLPCVSRGVLPGGLQYLDVCLPEVDVGDGAGRELDTRGGTDEAPNYWCVHLRLCLCLFCAVRWLRLCALVARVSPCMRTACVACGGGSHVTVDRHGRLARLTYVGGGSVETGNLVTLVGRHTSFLNGLVRWHGWLCCWWDMRSAAHRGDGSRFETTTPATLLT